MRHLARILGTTFICIETAYLCGLIGKAVLWCSFFAPVPPPPAPPAPEVPPRHASLWFANTIINDAPAAVRGAR